MADYAESGRGRLPALSEVNSDPAEPTLVRVVWLLNQVFQHVAKREWHGQEKIPKTGGVVFVVNHISNIDPIVFGQYLAYAGRYPRYLGKASLFRVPVVGRIITACGQIPVERGTTNASVALSRAVAAVRAGQSVTVYPEGTITLDPDLWPMAGKTGAARIALETGAPVVPIGQWGAQHLLGGKQLRFPKLVPRQTLLLKAGDPVDLDDLRARPITPPVLREATERIMSRLTQLVAELRGEEPPRERFDPRRRPKAPPTEGL